MRLPLLFLASFLALPAFAVEPDAPQTLITPKEGLGIAVRSTLEAKARRDGENTAFWDDLLGFYAERRGTPIWLDGAAFNPKATEAAAAMKHADEYGLNPADYNPPSKIPPVQDPAYPSEALAQAEADMSLAAIRYATQAQSGRLHPQDINDELFDPSPDIPKPSAVLKGVAEAQCDIRTYLEGFNPTHPQFVALREMLLGRRSGLSMASIPQSGPRIAPHATHPDVSLFRLRLHAPTPENGDPNFYDDALVGAIKSLQREHELKADGVITNATRQIFAPNPLPSRKVILANMERWRWLPRDLGETYIRINLPEYLVRLVRNGKTAFEERVVIGQVGHETPIFSEKMRTIVFNPYWNVPQSIIENELLPGLASGRHRGYEVLVKGRPVSPYTDLYNVNIDDIEVRQPPGGGNALGRLKFLFPNRHNVYLHDTPQKYLFNEKQRAFSHGCMRVRNPRQFAEAILGWQLTKINDAIEHGPENVEVALEPRIPVHVTYFTVWVEPNGEVKTFRDIYNHDPKIIEALHLKDN